MTSNNKIEEWLKESKHFEAIRRVALLRKGDIQKIGSDIEKVFSRYNGVLSNPSHDIIGSQLRNSPYFLAKKDWTLNADYVTVLSNDKAVTFTPDERMWRVPLEVPEEWFLQSMVDPDDADRILFFYNKKDRLMVFRNITERKPFASEEFSLIADVKRSDISEEKESKPAGKRKSCEVADGDKKPKAKKKRISVTLKRKVWVKEFGEEVGSAMCTCCSLTRISQLAFHCGHVIAEANGGETKLGNLRPVCQSCNSSMGTQNMEIFKASQGF